MTPEALLAVSAFAFATSLTTGPNNMMLMASGVNFGFRRTIPHMLGVAIGFSVMLAIVGFGLGALLTQWPAVQTTLRIACGLYMLLLAWRLATSGSLGVAASSVRPMSFSEAALFQWINPKAWAMTLTTSGLYVRPESLLASVLAVSVIFAVVGAPSQTLWTGFGVALRGFLADPARLRAFNIVMALVLAASVAPFIIPGRV